MTKLASAVFIVLFLQLFWTTPSEGARILVLFPPAAPSHFILGNALVKELANKGHDVTFISSYGSKSEKKNIKDIVLSDLVKRTEVLKTNILEKFEKSMVQQFNTMTEMTSMFTIGAINNTEVQKLIKNKEKFDLVIMENFLSEAHVAFAHVFDCPLIIVSTVGSNFWVNGFVGNEAPSSYIPLVLSDFTQSMNFIERLKNFLLTNTMEMMYYALNIPNQNKIIQQFFPGAPHINEIVNKHLALILLNSHPSISIAKPSVPNMIEIGGYHVAEPKPLPKDLKDYLDNSKQGFILFSMGSNLKSTMLPETTREMLMKVFAQLPYQVLWKFEDDQLPGKPKNVKIHKWLPQNDVLAHPNLKLFITHGGLLSTTEAIYHGVPVVGIPVFGDQKMNMASARNLGIGEYVPFKELSYDKLLTAIKTVLENKDYRQAARKRSALFRDQPIRPIDSAMYWIEYVLRHKYPNHLRTGAMELNWYQVNSLDVIAFLGSIVFVVFFSLYMIVKKCCCSKKVYPSEKSKSKQKVDEHKKKKH